jgi:hypothetical protein
MSRRIKVLIPSDADIFLIQACWDYYCDDKRPANWYKYILERAIYLQLEYHLFCD